MRSAVILAGGKSTRMNKDKGLVHLHGKTLVEHVVDRVSPFVSEIIIVVGSDRQRDSYIKTLGNKAKIIKDIIDGNSPLIGAITGLSKAKGDRVLIVACDMPFISPKVIDLLFKEGKEKNGALIEHPNKWIEPLLAVYNRELALKTAEKLYDTGNMRIRYILFKMKNVSHIPVERIQEFDPKLLSLFDVDNEEKLRKAENIMEEMNYPNT